MSLSLSAQTLPASAATRRQRWLLLTTSAVLHIVILVPVALNTVFLPELTPDKRDFEVWIELDRPRPVSPPLPKPQDVDRTRPEPVQQTTEQPQPQDTPQQPTIERQVTTLRPMTRLDVINAALPDVLKDDPVEVPRETLDAARTPSSVSALSPSPNITMAPRPHIEALDGPAPAANVQALNNNRLPGVQSSEPETPATPAAGATATGQDSVSSPDAPIPRRPRLSAEEEAALARAIAEGNVQDAWTYRPEGGGGAQGGGAGSAGQSGMQGGASAAGAGSIYFRGTPVDCTQPHLLSDIQKLSCDSADSRRIRSAVERGVRVQGTGNTGRDAENERQGRERIYEYEARRLPERDSNRGNVGVEDGVGSNFGIGVSGRHLDPTMQRDSVAPIQTRRDGPEELRPKRTPN